MDLFFGRLFNLPVHLQVYASSRDNGECIGHACDYFPL